MLDAVQTGDVVEVLCFAAVAQGAQGEEDGGVVGWGGGEGAASAADWDERAERGRHDGEMDEDRRLGGKMKVLVVVVERGDRRRAYRWLGRECGVDSVAAGRKSKRGCRNGLQHPSAFIDDMYQYSLICRYRARQYHATTRPYARIQQRRQQGCRPYTFFEAIALQATPSSLTTSKH